MANVTITGYARTTGGDQIPLRVDSKAEGTEHTVTTDTNLTVTAQDIGTYKPGSTVVSLELFCPNGISYAYILRQGTILAWGSVNVSGVNNKELMLCAPVNLRPGDTVRCLPLTATARNAALCVFTGSGVARIFVGTPSGAGTTALNDLQDSSNGIGDTLQGQTIVKAMFTAGGTQAQMPVSSGGAWIRNASGQLAGAVPGTNPVNAEPCLSMVNIPIALNWEASVVTAA